ncbi:MAG: DinB family protein [Chloroflexi bacterium]|nr:DinB family protein [Chloroflexota bacterium]
MPHPLVLQLRFTRSEFRRALKGLSDDEARQRFLPMNCISWNIGHLAWQEQRYFVFYGQGKLLLPEMNELFAYGAPASTPALAETWKAWNKITKAADVFLDSLTTEKMLERVIKNGKPSRYLFGSLVQRTIYHYWYHIGESMAIRQNLGHTRLPQFVGNLDGQAPYAPEPLASRRKAK